MRGGGGREGMREEEGEVGWEGGGKGEGGKGRGNGGIEGLQLRGRERGVRGGRGGGREVRAEGQGEGRSGVARGVHFWKDRG